MILLDTNIISETMRPMPSPLVLEWLNRQPGDSLFVSAITVGEIEYGLRILPAGKRRDALIERYREFMSRGFDGRILVYDDSAAYGYGEIMGYRKELGRPMSIPDGQIAAIAKSKGLILATRNTDDLVASGLHLINPFVA